jgi:hypothetical protein
VATTIDPVISDVLEAAAAGDWSHLRLLLHPYLHWTDDRGVTFRGRTNVLRWLASRAGTLQPPQHFELRDAQVYRWTCHIMTT